MKVSSLEPLVHCKTISKFHKNHEFCCQWYCELYPRTIKSPKMTKSRLVTVNGKGITSSWFHVCYYICLHGLSALNNRNVWFQSSVASRDGEGSPPDLHVIILWLYTHMTFLLGARRKRACSYGVSFPIRTSVWVSLNWRDPGTDEEVGTVLWISHFDSTQIK